MIIEKIVSPPKDYKHAVDLTGMSDSERAAAVKVAKFFASQYNWVLNEQDNKLYTGPVDREILVAVPDVRPGKIYLPAPWYSQRDTVYPGQAGRTCFSSTMAMAVKYLTATEKSPGPLSDSPNADDEYLARLKAQGGQTTDAGDQQRCLAYFGIKGSYHQNWDWAAVDKELEQGYPVGIGWLIWGTVAQPEGGGHWSLVVGKSGDSYIVHDPYGEADLAEGGYISSYGKAMQYSKENLGRRWMAGTIPGVYRYTPGTGWAMSFRKAS